MVQGATRQDTFTVDMDLTGAQAVYITYAQKRSGAYVEKSMSGISISVNAGKSTLVCQLSQADTLSFSEKEPVEIQVTVKTASGQRMTSNIVTDVVERALKTEEI